MTTQSIAPDTAGRRCADRESASAESVEVHVDAPADGHHEVRVADQGSFTVARCTCGWRSYARRSRNLARSEGREHAILYGPPTRN
jgi:hypothetical protein